MKIKVSGIFLILFSCFNTFAQQHLSSFVNPFIGTGGHGHTFPGAVLPFGMVQLSPDTRVDGSWDGCSGYHYSDNIIYGFSHTHLSGTGCSDWGDILIMPGTGRPSMDNKNYSSKFSHATEKAAPGFYEVKLDKDGIKAELTVTPRVGIHRYTFPKEKERNLVIDLLHRDKTLISDLKVLDSVTVTGYRISEAWAKEQHVYFCIQFSKPFKRIEYATGKKLNAKLEGRAEGAALSFDPGEEALLLKVGISFVNSEGAKKNLESEAPHWDFEKYKESAAESWGKQLNKIEIEENDKNKKTVFYTALYHCFIHPSLNMDVDEQYRGRDNKIHQADGFTNYSVFSLWDTYRALHPLFTILERKRTLDFINSFLGQYRLSGRLPVWELSSNETDCMIGYHSVSVIADAMAKGIRNFDTLMAFEAMKAASEYTKFGIPEFNRKGFLQIDDENESVSRSLEYAYDDWCIAQVASSLNREVEKNIYLKRSQAYRNLFDQSSGFMRPRKNGNWLSPFYASEINNHFTEGNSWQYSFYVPHDVQGLMTLHGGKINLEKKLDELFTTTEKTKGREQADVTGLLGQYAHGNEPSHHMAWLYNFVERPQKTIEKVRYICNNFYKNSPDGLIGNEDCGQMSAWYVFSSMGSYPFCPGSTKYELGEPQFKKITLNLENGNKFSILSDAAPNKPVKAVSINGRAQMNPEIDHAAIMRGDKLQFIYVPSADPKDVYGKQDQNEFPFPVILPAPIIASKGQVFKEKMELSIVQINSQGARCVYTTNGSEPVRTSTSYEKSFSIDTNCIVKAKLYAANDSSAVTEARFFKLKNNYQVQINSKAKAEYAAEGAWSLIDGIKGQADWRKGNWLGYQGQDFECVVDLKVPKEINYLNLECLQDGRAWILFPKQVSYFISQDNVKFILAGAVDNKIAAFDENVQILNFEFKPKQKLKGRYIKIVAKNFGKLPEGHQGQGGEAYIFTDELEIK